MIGVPLSPGEERQLRRLLQEYDFRLRRNGLGLPAGLAALLGQVSRETVTGAETPEERTRRLHRERSARWRARRRGEAVPLRRAGRPKTSPDLAA